ncbi:MAG: DciA family protein [Candidatus Omnitrophota bacterium]
MEPIREIINSVLRDYQTKKKQFNNQDPEIILKKLLTKREIQHIKFNYFRSGIFGIKVDSSAWIYQLNFKKQDLLSALKKNLPEIKDIRFSLGDINE